MNLTISRAKAESKSAKKPLAVVEAGEREAFDDFCAKLDQIAEAEKESAEELSKLRAVAEEGSAAVLAGDIEALAKCSDMRARAAEIETRHEHQSGGLKSMRARFWNTEGKVVVGILRRAHDEAVRRRDKAAKDELAEAQATGQRPTVSAAQQFLDARIKSLEVDLRDPERRLSNKRCARQVLADHLVGAE